MELELMTLKIQSSSMWLSLVKSLLEHSTPFHVGSMMTIPTTTFHPMSSMAGHGTDTGGAMSPVTE
eukprot:3343166-Rhodomonas_salina.1